MPRLSARAIKATLVLDPSEVYAIDPNVTPRITLNIAVDGRTVTADISAKALRRAHNLLAEHGTEAIACVLQGKLAKGDVLAECGLVAQLKAPKPVAAEAAA